MGIALPGLGGFNTQGIVEKLMSLEKVPLIKLQRRQGYMISL